MQPNVVHPKATTFEEIEIRSEDFASPSLCYRLTTPTLLSDKTGMGVNVRFKETTQDWDIWFDLRKGEVNGYRTSELGALEVMDDQQWSGNAPYEREGVGRFSTRWVVLATHIPSGEPVVFLSTHDHRKNVARVANRLTTLINYTNELLQPWEQEIREGYVLEDDEIDNALADVPPNFPHFPTKVITVEDVAAQAAAAEQAEKQKVLDAQAAEKKDVRVAYIGAAVVAVGTILIFMNL